MNNSRCTSPSAGSYDSSYDESPSILFRSSTSPFPLQLDAYPRLFDRKAREALEDQEDIRAADAAKKDIEKNGTIPWEEVKKQLGL